MFYDSQIKTIGFDLTQEDQVLFRYIVSKNSEAMFSVSVSFFFFLHRNKLKLTLKTQLTAMKPTKKSHLDS